MMIVSNPHTKLLSFSGVIERCLSYEIGFRILAVFPRSIFQDRESAEAETQHTVGIFRFKILLPLSGMLCAGFLFRRRARSAQKGFSNPWPSACIFQNYWRGALIEKVISGVGSEQRDFAQQSMRRGAATNLPVIVTLWSSVVQEKTK